MSKTACAPAKKLIPPDCEGKHNAPAYRPDIDGLRAIAVGAVLLFHARFGLSGGFAGVDIFFVISGFLITSLILKDAASPEGFSILRFWDRRIRRILPALLVVIVTTLIGGWFILLPSHFELLGKSVVAQAVVGGNFYFWLSSGYFSVGAHRLPLLHTWSLAVEEQFYLFFPLLFLFQSKWKISTLRWLFGLLATASLVLGIALLKTAPSVGFFLLPPRAWELLAGAIVAVAPRKLNIPLWAREFLGWSGFVAIGAAFCLYGEGTPFPGYAALLPCVGAMVLIWVNGLAVQPSTLARVLSIRPLVFLGKISYSLYLWHWPLLVYAWYWKENTFLPWYIRMGLLVLSIALSILSWKFVETPFRTRAVLPRRRHLFIFGVASPACCALVGAALMVTHGMPFRFSEKVAQYDRASVAVSQPKASISLDADLESALHGHFPQAGVPETPVQCLVWGDSHGMAVFPLFDKLAVDSACVVEFATSPASLPILNDSHHGGLRKQAEPWRNAVIENVRRKRIPNVVLVARWARWFQKNNSELANREVAEKLRATVLALRETGAKVWILKTVPEQRSDMGIVLAKALLKGEQNVIGCPKAIYTESSHLEDEIFAPAVASGAVILDPFPIFFDHRETCLVESSGYPLFLDDNHLSPSGALLLSDLLRPALKK